MHAVIASLNVLVLFWPIAVLHCQRNPQLNQGERVVVYQREVQWNLRQWHGPDVSGIVSSLRSDSLVVVTAGGTTVVVPLASVTELRVLRGKKRNVLRGMAVGSVTGFIAGAITGVIVGRSPDVCSETIMLGDPEPMLRVGCQVLLVPGLGVVGWIGGAMIGAAVGHLIRTDRWMEVPLDRLRVSSAPRRDGFALNVSFAF